MKKNNKLYIAMFIIGIIIVLNSLFSFNMLNTGSLYSTNQYKHEIAITSDYELTGYQQYIVIPYESGMESDFSNIKFTDTNDALLPCYLVSYTDSTSANFYVKTDLSIGENTINVIYGENIITNSDGSSVFDVFDDFNRADSSTVGGDWTESYGTSGEILNNQLRIGADALVIQAFDIRGHIVTVDMSYSELHSMRVFYTTSGTLWDGYAFQLSNTLQQIGLYNSASGGTPLAYTAYSCSPSTVYTVESIVLDDYSTEVRVWLKDSETRPETATLSYETFTPSSTTANIGLCSNTASGYYHYFDNFIVQQYVENTPTYIIGEKSEIIYEFTKQKTITLDNTGNDAITDYQLLITVPYDSDMQSDMDDIHFVDSDGETIIPHYTESVTDSTSAVVWIKVDIPSDSTKDITMYYGNTDVKDLSSDAQDIFIIYDECDVIDEDMWTITYEGGSAYSATVDDGRFKLLITTNSETVYKTIIESNVDYSAPYSVSYDFQNSVGSTKGSFMIYDFYLTDYYSLIHQEKNSANVNFNHRIYESGELTYDYTLGSLIGTDEHSMLINVDSNGNFEVYKDDILVSSDSTGTTDYTSVQGNFLAYVGGWDTNTNILWLDNIVVKKYVATEPTVSFGTEMTAIPYSLNSEELSSTSVVVGNSITLNVTLNQPATTVDLNIILPDTSTDIISMTNTENNDWTVLIDYSTDGNYTIDSYSIDTDFDTISSTLEFEITEIVEETTTSSSSGGGSTYVATSDDETDDNSTTNVTDIVNISDSNSIVESASDVNDEIIIAIIMLFSLFVVTWFVIFKKK